MPDDASAVAAFIHGAFAGFAMRPDFPVIVASLEQATDPDYETHFTIVTRSGLRIRVTVEPETEREQ